MSQPFLVVIGGSLAGRRLDLDPEKMRNVSVGSDPACDFRLETGGVSALHARLWLDAQGPVIYPTSPGAVFVNNERVMNQERRLSDGDLITLGMPGDKAVRFRYCETEATETTAMIAPGTSQTLPLAGGTAETEGLSPKAAQLRALLERKAAPPVAPAAVRAEWIAPPADPARPAVPVTTLPDVNAGLSPGQAVPTHTLPPMPPLEIDVPAPEPTVRLGGMPEATVRMTAPASAPPPSAQPARASTSSSLPLLAGAAAVLLLLAGGGFFLLRSRGAAPPPAASAPPQTQAPAPATLAEAPAETAAEVPTETATAVVPAATEPVAPEPASARPAAAPPATAAPRPQPPAVAATRPAASGTAPAPARPTAAGRVAPETAARPEPQAAPSAAAGDKDRGRFVAGTTRGDSTRTFDPSELKGFYTTDVRSKRRPGIDGRIEVAVTPNSVSSGEKYSVKFFLVNEGKKAIKIASVTLMTTVNGSRSGGPLGAASREVPAQGRILVHESTGVWQPNTASWVAEIVVTAENGDHLRSEVVWR